MLDKILLAIILPLVKAREYFVVYCLDISKSGEYFVGYCLAISKCCSLFGWLLSCYS